jgi:hypothetical protein
MALMKWFATCLVGALVVLGTAASGDGGQECAFVTFTLQKNSVAFEVVGVLLLDPKTNEILDSFEAPIGTPLPAPAGSHRMVFVAPDGFTVSPEEAHLDVRCGHDVTVKLRFSGEQPKKNQ